MHGKTLTLCSGFCSIIMAVISYMKTRLNSICDRKNVISGDELVCLIGTLISKFATVKKPLDLQSFSSSSSSKSSSKSSAASLVQLVPRQCPRAAEHSRSCFLHMHCMLLQSDKQLHLTTRNKDSGVG